MITAGSALIVTLLKKGDIGNLRAIEEQGFSPDMFVKVEEQKAFEVLKAHVLQYGALPSIELLEVEAETAFPRVIPDHPALFWADEVRNDYTLQFVADKHGKVQEALANKNLEKVLEAVAELYFGATRKSGRARTTTLQAAIQKVLQRHQEVQQRGQSVPGVPFGMPYLDAVTGGAMPGDCIVLAARPGIGKSFVVCQWALNAFHAGFRVMLVPMEMTDEHMARRIVALGAHANTTYLKMGQMSPYGLGDIQRYVDRNIGNRDPNDFVLLPGELNMTTDDVILRAQETNPDIIWVDGAYLLKTKEKTRQKHEAIEASTTELKQYALTSGIPVGLSHQFNREGPAAGLSGIAKADAIGQIASIVFGMEEDDVSGSMTYQRIERKLLKLIKGRDGEEGITRLLYNMTNAWITEDEVVEGVEGVLRTLGGGLTDEEDENFAAF